MKLDNLGFFVVVHDLYSLNCHIQETKRYEDCKNIKYNYICSINPQKTDIYNQKDIDIINGYDKNSLRCVFNRRLRFLTSLLYILENYRSYNYDYFYIKTCTIIKKNYIQEFLPLNIDEKLFFTLVVSKNYIMVKGEVLDFYKQYYYNIYNKDYVNDLSVIYNPNFVIIKKDNCPVLLDILNRFFEPFYMDKQDKKYWLPEVLTTVMCKYIIDNGYEIGSFYTKNVCIGEKKIHCYIDGK